MAAKDIKMTKADAAASEECSRSQRPAMSEAEFESLVEARPDDDFWFEEDYLEETAAEAFARMTPAEKAADRLYCQLLEEWLAEEEKRMRAGRTWPA